MGLTKIQDIENKIVDVLLDEEISFENKIRVLVNVHRRLYEFKESKENNRTLTENWEELKL